MAKHQSIDLARGVVAGVLIDVVRTRSGAALRVFATIAVLGAAAAVATNGVLRGLLVVVALAGALTVLVTLVLRRVAIATIRTFGEPTSVARHRADVQAAIDRADLPTGPIRAFRFAWRLRKGPGAELARLQQVARDLAGTLDG